MTVRPLPAQHGTAVSRGSAGPGRAPLPAEGTAARARGTGRSPAGQEGPSCARPPSLHVCKPRRCFLPLTVPIPMLDCLLQLK